MKPLLKEFFYVLTAAILIFFIMELISPAIVAAYININWVLILWLLNGILIILDYKKSE
jgi:hypothetical protein